MRKIDPKKLQEKIGFYPHKEQKKVLSAFRKKEIRDLAIVAGRRGGKSAICGYLALETLLQTNKRIWIAAPTYDLAKKPFDYVVRWIGKVSPELTNFISMKPTPTIRTPYGSFLECKSADSPQGFLGEEIDLLIIEEAAKISRSVFENYLYPTTSSRQGKIIYISSPWGKDWFHDQYIRAKTDKTSWSGFWTSKENPHFPIEEWDRARDKLPEDVFRQNYLAEFLDDAASVFRGIDKVIRKDILRDAKGGRLYTLGVDLGKHKDFTVLTMIDNASHCVVFWDRFKKIDWKFQKMRIKAAAKRYNNAKIIIDSTGLGDPIYDELSEEGLFVDEYTFSSSSKERLIKKLSIDIEQQNIFIPANEILIDELRGFGYTITEKSRRIAYSAPEGMHDDCVISLALANTGISGEADNKSMLQKEIEKRVEKSRKPVYTNQYI